MLGYLVDGIEFHILKLEKWHEERKCQGQGRLRADEGDQQNSGHEVDTEA